MDVYQFIELVNDLGDANWEDRESLLLDAGIKVEYAKGIWYSRDQLDLKYDLEGREILLKNFYTDDKHTITFRNSDKDKFIMQIRDPNWTHFMVL